MNKKLARLAERREHLLAQAAAQRTALTQNIEPWRAPMAVADRGLAVLRYLRLHPTLSLGASLLIVPLLKVRAGKWLGRAWTVWQLARKFLRK